MPTHTAAEIIRRRDLKPHPEGGHYRETFRDPRQIDGRAASTAILFLLARGERSHWHSIDAVEIWHYYAGARHLNCHWSTARPKKLSGSAPISPQARFRR
jgi:predicted cupin superfamily sugar epimerase